MRGLPYVFSNFNEGVNIEGAPYSLDAGQAREGLNVRSTPEGAIKKRNGCVTLATPEDTLHSLFGCNLGTDILLGAGGTSIYKVSTSGIAQKIKTTGISAGVPWEWIQAPVSGGQGPIYGVNGTDTPQRWSGEAIPPENWVASKGSVPNGKYIAYHENRVWIAKGNTLYWSDITDPLNWETGDAGNTLVDPEDGQEITGLGKVGNYLLVFKDRKTFVMFDSNTGAYRRISEDMGCASNRSIVSTEKGTFFFSSDGEIVVTDGQSFDRVSQAVAPLFRNISSPMKGKVCAIHQAEKVYFSVSQSGSVNDTILEYNLNDNSWWIHKIYYTSSEAGGVNQFALLDPTGSATLYAAGSSTTVKKVFKCFVAGVYIDLASQVFTTYWISPWHVFTYPHIRKRMREIRVDSLGTFELFTARSFRNEYVKEEVKNWEVSGEGSTFGGAGAFGGEGTFGDVATIIEKRFYTPGQGRAWSLKFESNDNQNLEIYSYTTAINYKKD